MVLFVRRKQFPSLFVKIVSAVAVVDLWGLFEDAVSGPSGNPHISEKEIHQ